VGRRVRGRKRGGPFWERPSVGLEANATRSLPSHVVSVVAIPCFRALVWPAPPATPSSSPPSSPASSSPAPAAAATVRGRFVAFIVLPLLLLSLVVEVPCIPAAGSTPVLTEPLIPLWLPLRLLHPTVRAGSTPVLTTVRAWGRLDGQGATVGRWRRCSTTEIPPAAT
jgi:hypothetical protein